MKIGKLVLFFAIIAFSVGIHFWEPYKNNESKLGIAFSEAMNRKRLTEYGSHLTSAKSACEFHHDRVRVVKNIRLEPDEIRYNHESECDTKVYDKNYSPRVKFKVQLSNGKLLRIKKTPVRECDCDRISIYKNLGGPDERLPNSTTRDIFYLIRVSPNQATQELTTGYFELELTEKSKDEKKRTLKPVGYYKKHNSEWWTDEELRKFLVYDLRIIV